MNEFIINIQETLILMFALLSYIIYDTPPLDKAIDTRGEYLFGILFTIVWFALLIIIIILTLWRIWA